jgi:TonB family protein
MTIRPTTRLLLLLAIGITASFSVRAQDLRYTTHFTFEPAIVDKQPDIRDVNVDFPDEGRKNGVEGTVKISFTMAGDGHTRDLQVLEDLPSGVGDAVKKAVERLKFTPASFHGQPVDLKATLTFVIVAWFTDDDSSVSKVKLLTKPAAPYPEKFRSQGMKGDVYVAVAFYSDGTKLEVVKSESTMQPEFDEAAKKAAASLKFQPAVHKKSKKPVNQVMWVKFEFKP